MSPGCTSWIDFPLPFAYLTTFKVTSTSWSFALTIPKKSSYAGLSVTTQAWYLHTDSKAGWDLTNGVMITLGK